MSPVLVCFGKSDFLWQLMMTLIIYAIHLFLPQASSIAKLGIVSWWRSNEWISQHSAIHHLLHSGSEWLATALRTLLQKTSRQEQGPACQSNCQGKHKAEKTAGPLFPYAADALTHADWAVYDPLAREKARREDWGVIGGETVCWLLRCSNTNAIRCLATCNSVSMH